MLFRSVAEKAATCTEDGYEAYWKCEGCDKLFSDAEGKNEITAPVTVKAKGHTGGTATCTQKATCSVCGEEYGELAAHVYDKEVADAEYLKSAATCTSLAVYYKSCVCGAKGTETFTSGEVGDHSWSEWSDANGKDSHSCVVCGKTENRTVFNAVDATYSGVSANPNGYLSGTAAGGAVVTFTINSSAACEAELIISLAKAGTGLPISQLYDITVNNTSYTGYTDVTPEYAGWEEFRDGSLGDVQLQEGVNTITFTSKSNDQQIAYNFKSIKLITVGVEISAGQA